MTDRKIISLRSNTAAKRPPGDGSRSPGELYVNFPDLQLGVVDMAKKPQDLIAVTYHSVKATYAVGRVVVYKTGLYKASKANTGPFVITNWDLIGTVNLGTTLADSTVTITNTGGADVTIPAATINKAGVLSKADKIKLQSVVAGAKPDQTLGINPLVGSVEFALSNVSKVSLPGATTAKAGAMTRDNLNLLNSVKNTSNSHTNSIATLTAEIAKLKAAPSTVPRTGSWNPRLIGIANTTVASSTGGWYQRVGNLVTVFANVTWRNLYGAGNSGQVQIGGLPFTVREPATKSPGGGVMVNFEGLDFGGVAASPDLEIHVAIDPITNTKNMYLSGNVSATSGHSGIAAYFAWSQVRSTGFFNFVAHYYTTDA